MKRAITLLLFLWGLVRPTIANEEQGEYTYEANLTSDDVDLLIQVVRQPLFPENLRNAGYSRGRVDMLLELHHDGELRDWLVTEANHKDFAEAVDTAIDEWEFAPPKKDGKPISLVVPIRVNFEAGSDVISFDMSAGLNHYMRLGSNYDPSQSIKIAEVDKLDKFPEPVHVVKPRAPRSWIEKNNDTVGVFRFFIDTKGEVRLAHVDHVEGEIDVRLLEVAQDALEQWQFSPPTVNGKGVVVEVKQPFHFRLLN